jgi:hypothetical protein
MGKTKQGTTRTTLGFSAQTSLHSPFLLCLALVRDMQYIAPGNIATTMSTTNTWKLIPLLEFMSSWKDVFKKTGCRRKLGTPAKVTKTGENTPAKVRGVSWNYVKGSF